MKEVKLYSVFFALLLFLSPLLFAINIDVQKHSSYGMYIKELENPVIINLKIKNLGASDSFMIYNLIGIGMSPSDPIEITSGEEKIIQLTILPRTDTDVKGLYTFPYYIRSIKDSSEVKEDMAFKIAYLENSFEIGSGEINPESSSIKIYLKNKEDYNFGEVTAVFSSAFFNINEKFNLGPAEQKSFDVQLNKEDIKKLMAGFYTLAADIDVQGHKTKSEGTINFVEKDILTVAKKDFGFIINTQTIEKMNDGNVVTGTETVIKKDIISRLFTTFGPEPNSAERKGIYIYYTWRKNLNPGEVFQIKTKTNWTFPFFLLISLVMVVVFAKKYTQTNIVLRKRVSFVNAKGGEFALKITIFVHAKKYVEKVSVIDKLPSIVRIYERFGGEQPSKVNEKTRRIEWNFEKMDEGEVRTISYIIYSKVGVLGKFTLPTATAIYERDGKICEDYSNRAYFIAEEKKNDLE